MITRRSTPSARDARTMSLAPRVGMLVIALVATLSGLFTAQHTNAQNPFGDIPGLSNPAPEVPAGQEVVVSARLVGGSAAPGGQALVEVTFDIAEGWKVWPSASQDVLPQEVEEFAERTAVWLSDSGMPAGMRVSQDDLFSITPDDSIGAIGGVQWPKTKLSANPLFDPPQIEVIKGRAKVYIPILIAEDAAAGPSSLDLGVYYQACSASLCHPPVVEQLRVDFVIDPATSPELRATDLEGFDGSAYASMAQGDGLTPPTVEVAPKEAEPAEQPETPARTLFGFSVSSSLFGLLIAGMIGGALLNLMPCVLPVIPLKVMALSRHAQDSKARAMYLGTWMAGGVVAFWVGVGIPVMVFAGQLDPSKVFSIWYITAGMGLILCLLALGTMDVFTMKLPQRAYMFNPQADSASGSFFFGVMTAVLGLPCFGPIVGGLMAGGASMGAFEVLAIFGGIGLGMGTPYLVLSAFPGLVKKIPQAGPMGELIKQAMGLLMFAAGGFFLATGVKTLMKSQPYLATDAEWLVAGLIGAIAGLWVLIKSGSAVKGVVGRAAIAWVGLMILATSIWITVTFAEAAKQEYIKAEAALAEAGESGIAPGVWLPFSEERLRAAREEGHTVFVEFTADWCISCRAFKKQIIEQPSVADRLHRDDIVLLEADYDLPAVKKYYGDVVKGKGIPTWIIFGPGEEAWESVTLPTTPSRFLDDLEEIAGPAPSPEEGEHAGEKHADSAQIGRGSDSPT